MCLRPHLFLCLMTLTFILLALPFFPGCGGEAAVTNPPGSGSDAVPDNVSGYSSARPVMSIDANSEAKPAAELESTCPEKTPKSDDQPFEASVQTAAAGDIVIDQHQADRFGTPSYWKRANGYGHNGWMDYTLPNGSSRDNWMRWRSRQPAGRYTLKVFVPRNYATTRNARYLIQYLSGSNWVTAQESPVNQNVYYDAWVTIGELYLPGEPAVVLGDDTGESWRTGRKIGFDAVAFRRVDGGSRLQWPTVAGARVGNMKFGATWIDGWKKHVGVDISVPAGTPVYAAETGTVAYRGYDSRWRGWVTIQHNSGSVFTTVYWHIVPTVSRGAQVRRGQRIGAVASMSGAHLHFGMRNGAYTNISNRGALPPVPSGGDPAFPENFVDPLRYTGP